MSDQERHRFRRVTWVNLVANLAKILIEGTVGILFGSVALLADAAHSVADLIASAVVLVWGDRGYDGADRSHPHGHGRFEPVTALVVGLAIVLMGSVLLFESVQGAVSGQPVTPSPALFIAALLAIGLMALTYAYTVRVNRGIGSTALRALAVDCRNDVFTSIAVLGGILGVLVGYPMFDAIAGGIVSMLVIGQGLMVGRENLPYLLGTAAPPEQQRRVTEELLDHAAVMGVHDLVVFYDGTSVEVEAHVEVDGDMTLREAHEIETTLVDRVRDLGWVGDAHVHLDPSGIGEWKDADE